LDICIVPFINQHESIAEVHELVVIDFTAKPFSPTLLFRLHYSRRAKLLIEPFLDLVDGVGWTIPQTTTSSTITTIFLLHHLHEQIKVELHTLKPLLKTLDGLSVIRGEIY